MKLTFTSTSMSRQAIRALDKPVRKMIGAEIRRFQQKQRVNIKKLQGEENTWRIAAGDWRVILTRVMGEPEETRIVKEVLPRRDAYR